MTNPVLALVQRFDMNPLGRDLIVGDAHGHATKLRAALAALEFDASVGDRLFIVGDLVDRGPESEEMVAMLDEPGVYSVAGNHEAILLDWFEGTTDNGYYRACGGGWFMELPHDRRCEIAARLARLPVAIELQTPGGLVGIVHADCPHRSWPAFVQALEHPKTAPMERAHLIAMAQWSRNRADHGDASLVAGVRAVVVGHTPMRQWTSLGNVLFIDTGAWKGDPPLRPFTILDASTLQPAVPRTEHLLWADENRPAS